jgi:hypothetical protein
MAKKRKVDSDSESESSIDSSAPRKKVIPAADVVKPQQPTNVVQKANNKNAPPKTAKRKAVCESESENDSDDESSFGASSKSTSPVKKPAAVDSKVSTIKKVASSHSAPKSTKPPMIVESSSVPASDNNLTTGGPVTTEAAAKKLISQYLKMQNRPYSAIQIHDNLHGRIPKAVTERALVYQYTIIERLRCIINLNNHYFTIKTSLSSGEGSDILCKEYGKCKIYFMNQITCASSDFTDEQVQQLESENQELSHSLNAILAEEKQLAQQLKELQGQPSDQNLSTCVNSKSSVNAIVMMSTLLL